MASSRKANYLKGKHVEVTAVHRCQAIAEHFVLVAEQPLLTVGIPGHRLHVGKLLKHGLAQPGLLSRRLAERFLFAAPEGRILEGSIIDPIDIVLVNVELIKGPFMPDERDPKRVNT